MVEHDLWSAPTDDELDVLTALGKGGEWTLGGHRLRLTNLDKILFPAGAGHRALTKSTWSVTTQRWLRPDRWTIDDIAERLRRAGDPLAPLIGRQQRLPAL